MKQFIRKLILVTIGLILLKTVPSMLWNEPTLRPVSPSLSSTDSKAIGEVLPRQQREAALGSWMGKDADDLIKTYGEPARVDQTEYHFDWWIYNQELTNYRQFAIRAGKIVSVVGAGEAANVSPYRIGEQVGQYNTLIDFQDSIQFHLNGEKYSVKPKEADYSTQPLVEVGNHLAVVYIDKIAGVVSAVRFIDQQMVVDLALYPFTYTGELPHAKVVSRTEKQAIQRGYELEVVDITNAIRLQKNLTPLIERADVSQVSRLHSQDMFDNDYFSHVSLDDKTLADRMAAGKIEYRLAAENIAMGYTDSLAVVEGWLNSPKHREALLNPDFTWIGSGIEGKYYTQNFIKK